MFPQVCTATSYADDFDERPDDVMQPPGKRLIEREIPESIRKDR